MGLKEITGPIRKTHMMILGFFSITVTTLLGIIMVESASLAARS